MGGDRFRERLRSGWGTFAFQVTLRARIGFDRLDPATMRGPTEQRITPTRTMDSAAFLVFARSTEVSLQRIAFQAVRHRYRKARAWRRKRAAQDFFVGGWIGGHFQESASGRSPRSYRCKPERCAQVLWHVGGDGIRRAEKSVALDFSALDAEPAPPLLPLIDA